MNVLKDLTQMHKEIRNSAVLHLEKEEAAVAVYSDAETCSPYWLSQGSQDYVTFQVWTADIFHSENDRNYIVNTFFNVLH